jgi:hypothetical protein
MNAIIRKTIADAADKIEFTTKDEFVTALLASLFPEAEKPAKKPAAPKAKKAPVLDADDDDEPAVNLEKFTPTMTKKIKEKGVDSDKFKEYLNSLTAKDYKDKKFDAHLASFVDKTHIVPEEMAEVEFENKTYYVGDDKRVWELSADGKSKILVGNVGMAKFKEMTLDE